MPLEYFDPDANTFDVIAALRRDGAVVVKNQIAPELADTVLAELREPFDKVGKYDENDFNGYTTLRVSSVLAISPTSPELVAHPRVLSDTHRYKTSTAAAPIEPTSPVPREIAEKHSETIQQLMGYQLHRTLGAFQHPDGTWFEN